MSGIRDSFFGGTPEIVARGSTGDPGAADESFTGEVTARLVEDLKEDGSGLRVFEVIRSHLNGTVEEWTFSIDQDHLLQRVALTVTSGLEPTRNVWDAQLEFISWGEYIPLF
jgi:hypothetical protein